MTYQGEITDTYKEYSDRMLELLLKAHRPDKFVEKRQLEHGLSPQTAELIRQGMSAKEAAEKYRDELG